MITFEIQRQLIEHAATWFLPDIKYIIIIVYFRTKYIKINATITKLNTNISTIDHNFFAFWFKDKTKKLRWFYLGSSPCKFNIFRVEHTIKLL